MKITVGKFNALRQGVEINWDGMSFEMTPEELVHSNETWRKMFPEIKQAVLDVMNRIEQQEAERDRKWEERSEKDHIRSMELEEIKQRNWRERYDLKRKARSE